MSDGVVVEATYVTSNELRCLTPPLSAVGKSDALVYATHNKTAALMGDGGYAFGASAGGQWSTSQIRLTYVDVSLAPTLYDVDAPYASLMSTPRPLLIVKGTNFAPTDELACHIAHDSTALPQGASLNSRSPATFVSGNEIRCYAPATPTGTIPHDSLLHVRLSDTGPVPPASQQFTYYDPTTPPTIALLTPGKQASTASNPP